MTPASAASGVWTLPLASVEEVALDTCWLRFEPPAPVPCEPGQFFMLGPATPSGALFLGRPFSIGDVRADGWRFLLRELGRGTAWLRAQRPGAPLRIVGPLGRPFERRPRQIHRLVAGGVGIAPFFLLARRLRTERPAERIELHYGERRAAFHGAVDEDAAGLFDAVVRYTDDGSRGRPGTVVDGIDGMLGDDGVAWYACGPRPMLRALALRLEERGVSAAQFSLEERMGCGFGVCQACIVPVRRPPPRYRLLCVDGPVVDPLTVAW